MANLTVTQIRSILERYRNDSMPRLNNETFLDFANDLTLDVREYLKDINSEDYIWTQSITPSTAYQTTALNSDFWNVLWQNTGVYVLDSNSRITTPQLEEINPWSQERWFYISWTDVIIRGWENTTLQLRYFTDMTDLTLVSDFTIFPNQRKYYPTIRNCLNMLYNGWLNDTYEEQRSSVKYQQDVANLSMYARKQTAWLFFEPNIY